MANPNQTTAFRFFKSRGYSDVQAAGIIGNLLGESNLNPSARGDRGAARGIGQWHPDRWSRYVNHLPNGADPYSLENQLDFVDYELHHHEKAAFKNLMAATSVDAATAAFIGYERPAGWTPQNPRAGHNFSGRLAFAEGVLGKGQGLPEPVAPMYQNGVLGQANNRSTTGPSDNPYTVDSGHASISDITPNNPFTVDEVAAQNAEIEAQRQAMTPGPIETAQLALEQENSLAWIFKQAPQFRPVAGHQTNWDEVTKDIPEEYWDKFVDSSSPAQDEYIRKSIIDQMRADQKLANAGGWGVAARIAAGATDPVAWAAGAGITLATEGTGLPAFLAARYGKLGTVALGALEGAGGAAVPEAIIHAKKPTSTNSELLMGIAAGALLGGAFGSFAKTPAQEAVDAAFTKQGEDMLKARLPSPQSTAGAAQASVKQPLRTDISEIVRDGADLVDKPFGGSVRFDLAGSLKKSDNPLVRILGNVLVEDGVRNAKGVTPVSVSEEASKMFHKSEVRWRKSFNYAFKAYAKRTGIKPSEFRVTRTKFAKDVTEYVRSRNPMDNFESEAVSVGNEFRAMMKDFHDLAANPGIVDGSTRRAVRGFDRFTDNPHYVPRSFDLGAIGSALEKFGTDNLARLIARGMQSVNKELSDELAQKFGHGYIQKLYSLSAGELSRNQRALAGEDMDALKQLLFDGTDLSQAELDDILLGLKKPAQGGAVPRAKKRLFYDENFGLEMGYSDGSGSEFFKISDLFMNDADDLMKSYSRQMSGRIAMARLRVRNPKWQPGDEGSEFLIDGVTNDSEWETLMSKVIAVGAETGSTSQTRAATRNLQFAYDTIVGRPHWDEYTKFAQGLRMLRDYNFLRVMGQVGFAQVPEFFHAASSLGMRAMFTNMPSLKAMWRNAKTGQLDDALAAEWEDLTGFGADYLRHSDLRRVDEFENPLGGIREDSLLGKIDHAQQVGKRAMGVMSGMTPVNTFLQRVTGRGIFNKFALMAQQGAPLEADKRMLGLGIETPMLNRIADQIRKHATFDGKRLKLMNFKKWDDPEAMAHFENGVSRYARQLIQENDIGNMAAWMSRPTARTLLQFRTFMISAWAKQFLHGLNHLDFKTFASFTTTAFVGAMTYIMRTYANSVGRSDGAEWRDKQLSISRIVASGLQNSSWFTLIAPFADTAWTSLGNESVFTGRNTQQKTDLVLGNPTVSLINQVLKAPKSAIDLARGNGNKADANAIKQMLIMQNTMGITQLFNLMVGGLEN